MRPQCWAPSTAKTNNHRTRNIKHSQQWRGDRSPADMVSQGLVRQRVPGVFSLLNISWIWKGASQQLGNAKEAKKKKRLPQKPALPSQGPEKGQSNKNRTLSDENGSNCSQTPQRSCGSHPTTARKGQTGAGMSALTGV